MADSNDTRRVVVHIGQHKTGSTAFQAALVDAREDLERLDVAVFHSSVVKAKNQAGELPLLTVRPELVFPMRARNPDASLPEGREVMRQIVAQQVARPKGTLIASAEALSFIRTEEEARALRDLLSGREVEIVVALRDPAGFLESWVNQLERMDLPTTSPFPTSLSYTHPDTWLVDHEGLLAPFRAVFGSEHVHVLDYDAIVARDSTIIPALWETCGLPVAALKERERQRKNVRRPAKQSQRDPDDD